MDVTIKEDGTITLPLLTQHVQADGKTTGQLEKDIWQSYVPSYYKHMTVIVKAQGQKLLRQGRGEVTEPLCLQQRHNGPQGHHLGGRFYRFRPENERESVPVGRTHRNRGLPQSIEKAQPGLAGYPGDLINVERRTSPFQK